MAAAAIWGLESLSKTLRLDLLHLSKGFRKSSLPKNAVCGELRFQISVDRHAYSGAWVPPNLVVAAALSLEFVTAFSQQAN
jgi:hypothetical protein